MTIVTIPLQVDNPSYSFRITLSGVSFTLHFDWNGRLGRWYFALHDVLDQPLYRGMRVVCDWPVHRKCVVDGRPKGHILFSDGNAGDPPGLSELGRRVLCYYVEP